MSDPTPDLARTLRRHRLEIRLLSLVVVVAVLLPPGLPAAAVVVLLLVVGKEVIRRATAPTRDTLGPPPGEP